MLPVDHVVVTELKEGAPNEVVETVPAGKMGVDIGPRTIEQFSKAIAGAKTSNLERTNGRVRKAAVR